MKEPAHMVYALHEGAGGWKIASWAWTGGKAEPDLPKPKPAAAPAASAAPAAKH
jgi:hypothetical protein